MGERGARQPRGGSRATRVPTYVLPRDHGHRARELHVPSRGRGDPVAAARSDGARRRLPATSGRDTPPLRVHRAVRLVLHARDGWRVRGDRNVVRVDGNVVVVVRDEGRGRRAVERAVVRRRVPARSRRVRAE